MTEICPRCRADTIFESFFGDAFCTSCDWIGDISDLLNYGDVYDSFEE